LAPLNKLLDLSGNAVARAIMAGLWIWSIAVPLWGAFANQQAALGPPFPADALPLVIAMPIVVVCVVALFAKHSPFYVPMLAGWIDARAGEKSYESFLVRLRPLLMFAVSAFLSSGIALIRAAIVSAPPEAYVEPSFFLSGAIAFVLLHVILRRKGAIGV
jgi:hypothetical protein